MDEASYPNHTTMTSLRKVNRRSFLKAAAIAGTAPLILPSGLWADDASPSKQITLGFIGIGTPGHGLMEN